MRPVRPETRARRSWVRAFGGGGVALALENGLACRTSRSGAVPGSMICGSAQWTSEYPCASNSSGSGPATHAGRPVRPESTSRGSVGWTPEHPSRRFAVASPGRSRRACRRRPGRRPASASCSGCSSRRDPARTSPGGGRVRPSRAAGRRGPTGRWRCGCPLAWLGISPGAVTPPIRRSPIPSPSKSAAGRKSSRDPPDRSRAGPNAPSARQTSGPSPRNAQVPPTLADSPQRSSRPSPSRSADLRPREFGHGLDLAAGRGLEDVHGRRIGVGARAAASTSSGAARPRSGRPGAASRPGPGPTTAARRDAWSGRSADRTCHHQNGRPSLPEMASM